MSFTSAKKALLRHINSEGCTCQSCGSNYALDVSVPDKVWEQIKPEGKPEGAGLLCPQCIANRLCDTLTAAESRGREAGKVNGVTDAMMLTREYADSCRPGQEARDRLVMLAQELELLVKGLHSSSPSTVEKEGKPQCLYGDEKECKKDCPACRFGGDSGMM